MIKILPYIFFILSISSLNAQKDPCTTTDKKLIKALEPFKLEVDVDKASLLYAELSRAYPENAELPFLMAQKCNAYAKKLARDPKKEAKAENYANQAIILFFSSYKKCKTFHAETIYIIASGLIREGDTEKAIPYLNEYLTFPEDDLTRLPSDHEQRKKIVNEFLDEYNVSLQFIQNPVPFQPYLVNSISTDLDEYFPMISPDNDLMFFTRKINRKNLGDIDDNIREEFTVAQKLSQDQNTFNAGDPLPFPFNDTTFFNYGTASLSADNKEMIICACKMEKVYNKDYLNCDLYMTTYTRSGKGGNDFKWTALKNMGEGINTSDGWEAQPSLSSDGKKLYFATNRKGSQDNDIYYSDKQEDGTWSTAKPFSIVNTPGKDKSPFFHQDGETLYYVSECSKKNPGLGGLDIFYIRKTGESWTKPTNMGYPINTEGDELGVFISTQGDLAYYSSYQNKNWEIYGFELYEKARPQRVVIFKGSLTDEKNKPITDGSVEIAYGNNKEKITVEVNKEDGQYTAVVKIKDDEPITVTLKKSGTAFNSQIVTKENLLSNNVKRNIQVEKLVSGKSYAISDILFTSDSFVLQDNTKIILSKFAEYLKENPNLKIAIHGHTDDLGDDLANLNLSKNRADAVKNFLLSLGIDKTRIGSEGFGEKKPKFPNTSNENRSKNRRTEFLLISNQ